MALAAADQRVEIISGDSMQVYRGMDIGTAKPTPEEQRAVRHHLIDVVDPHEDFALAEFIPQVEAATAKVASRGGVPVLVGGTGLYVQAIVDGLDLPGQFPEARSEVESEPDTAVLYQRLQGVDAPAAERIDPANRRRIVRALEVTLGSGRRFSSYGPGMDRYAPSHVHQIACDRPRPSLDNRIDARYDEQMRDGFLAEVEQVASGPGGMSRTACQALGYKELLQHIDGELSLEDALDLARRRTRRFARRQQRWFRRDPRIEWIDLDQVPIAKCVEQCRRHLPDS